MNNKENSLWEMCERKREFSHFLMFRSGWKWYRCEDGFLRKQLNAATFSTNRLRHTESCGNETRI